MNWISMLGFCCGTLGFLLCCRPVANDNNQLPKQTEYYILNAAKSEVKLTLAPPQAIDKAIIQIIITEVTNPENDEVVIDAWLNADGKLKKLGSFSLFPNDKPGNFLFDVSSLVKPSMLKQPITVLVRLRDVDKIKSVLELKLQAPKWYIQH